MSQSLGDIQHGPSSAQKMQMTSASMSETLRLAGLLARTDMLMTCPVDQHTRYPHGRAVAFG